MYGTAIQTEMKNLGPARIQGRNNALFHLALLIPLQAFVTIKMNFS